MLKIQKCGETPVSEILSRATPTNDVEAPVAEIIAAVRERGDAALREYTERFDGVELDSFEVSAEEIEAAIAETGEELMGVMRRAAENIRAFHSKQIRSGFVMAERDGVTMGQLVIPIDSVGLYVPGGTAPYPSSVLMDAVPAKLAGCRRLVMVTPPGRDGKVSAPILAAASVVGIDKIYKLGGAQAIAALAYGTESIAPVDKLVGPGNAYVAEAKKQVFGKVAIDNVSGPSEIIIISDGKTDPRWVSADMLAQAEHDVMSSAVLITDSYELALAVQCELELQLNSLARREIAAESLRRNGRIILTRNLAEAMDIANELAPEHLEICVDEPFTWLSRVRNAGSVFLGRSSPEALGDYLSGTNHTLPTGGTARFGSPLSVDDFVKKTQYTCYSEAALAAVGGDIMTFAAAEGLGGHAESVRLRMEENV